MDPVAVVAGIIKAEFPSSDMQTAAKVAWDIVNALKQLAELKVATPEEGK